MPALRRERSYPAQATPERQSAKRGIAELDHGLPPHTGQYVSAGAYSQSWSCCRPTECSNTVCTQFGEGASHGFRAQRPTGHCLRGEQRPGPRLCDRAGQGRRRGDDYRAERRRLWKTAGQLLRRRAAALTSRRAISRPRRAAPRPSRSVPIPTFSSIMPGGRRRAISAIGSVRTGCARSTPTCWRRSP